MEQQSWDRALAIGGSGSPWLCAVSACTNDSAGTVDTLGDGAGAQVDGAGVQADDTDTGGCDYSTKPFAHRGPCGDAGVDAEAHPDAEGGPMDACALGGDCDAGQEWDASAYACVPRAASDAGGSG